MAIEPVNVPATLRTVDPKLAAEKKDGDKNYWQQKADEAKARHDYMEYENAIKMLGAKPAESPFQVKGEINLGNYNPQEQQKEAQTRMDQALKDKDEKIDAERKRAEEAERKLNEEKLDTIRRDFSSQMTEIQKTMEKLATANQNEGRSIYEKFLEQYKGAMEVAKTFGGEKTTSGHDPTIDLQIKKMEFENIERDREFQWKMRQDEKHWEMEKLKIADDHSYRQAQLNQESKKTEMIANFPTMIGAAIAKGLMDRGQGETQQQGIQQRGVNQEPAKSYHIETTEGQGGEVICPQCKTMIGFGPTQDAAQCINCKTNYKIQRAPGQTQPPPPPHDLSEVHIDQPISTYEEDN